MIRLSLLLGMEAKQAMASIGFCVGYFRSPLFLLGGGGGLERLDCQVIIHGK